MFNHFECFGGEICIHACSFELSCYSACYWEENVNRWHFLKRPSLLPAFLSLPLNNLPKVKQLGLYFIAKIVNSCFWSVNHGGCIPKIFPHLNKNFWWSRQCQPLKMCSSEQNLVRLYQKWKVLSYQKNSRNTARISPTLEKTSNLEVGISNLEKNSIQDFKFLPSLG